MALITAGDHITVCIMGLSPHLHAQALNVLLVWIAAQRPMTITRPVSPSWAPLLTATPPTHPTGIANKWAKSDSHHPGPPASATLTCASSPYQWTIILPSPQLLKPELENHHHLPFHSLKIHMQVVTKSHQFSSISNLLMLPILTTAGLRSSPSLL